MMGVCSIIRIRQLPHGKRHVLFDCLHADTDAPGDLRIGKLLDPMKEKDLATPVGHRIDHGHDACQALRAH